MKTPAGASARARRRRAPGQDRGPTRRGLCTRAAARCGASASPALRPGGGVRRLCRLGEVVSVGFWGGKEREKSGRKRRGNKWNEKRDIGAAYPVC